MEPIREETQLKAPWKTLFLDLDGTLLGADSFDVNVGFVRGWVNIHRKKMGRLGAIRFLTALRNAVEKQEGAATNFSRGIEVAARYYGTNPEQAEQEFHNAIRILFRSIRRHFYPMVGAKDFLFWAKEHYPLVLATNPVWPREFIDMRLMWAGLEPKLFRSITDASVMHSCKPFESYYAELLEREGLLGSECLHIGNDPHKDLVARRTGIHVFLINPKQTQLEVVRTPRPGSKKGYAWSGNFQVCREFLEKRMNQG